MEDIKRRIDYLEKLGKIVTVFGGILYVVTYVKWITNVAYAYDAKTFIWTAVAIFVTGVFTQIIATICRVAIYILKKE